MIKKIGEFFKQCGGFIIGAIFGALMICLGIIDFIVALLIVFIFGCIGACIQRNKLKIKEVLMRLLEKW